MGGSDEVHLFTSQPVMRAFTTSSLTVDRRLPLSHSEHPQSDRCLSATTHAVSDLMQGNVSTLQRYFTPYTELVLHSTLPFTSRVSTPLHGFRGFMSILADRLRYFTYLNFSGQLLIIHSTNLYEVRIMLSGTATHRMNATGRVVNHPFVRIWAWDAVACMVARHEFYEMDQPLTDELNKHVEHSSHVALTRNSELWTLQLEHVEDGEQSPDSTLNNVAESEHCTWPGVQRDAECPPQPLHAQVEHHLSPTSPFVLPTDTVKSSLTISSTQAPARPSRQSICKLHLLLLSCERYLACEVSTAIQRGARRLCSSCKAACCYLPTHGAMHDERCRVQTVFKPFTIEAERMLLVRLTITTRAQLSVVQGQTYKRRRKERGFAVDDLNGGVENGSTKKLLRKVNQECQIDDQGRLLNRDRTVSVSSSSVDADKHVRQVLNAKRLTLSLSGAEELYLYVFCSRADVELAAAHWQRQSAVLLHVDLCCYLVRKPVQMTYQHGPEELRIELSSLASLRQRDSASVQLWP